LAHAQHYSMRVSITNGFETGAFDGLAFWNTVEDKFALDPTGEDEADDGVIGGSCTDGVCDGVISSGNCLVTISGPSVKKNRINLRYVIIEPNGLDRGTGGDAINGTCDTTVFLVTKQASGSGKGKKAAASFEPIDCQEGATSSAASLFNTVTLSKGVRAFDAATKELLLGPVGSIELEPIGCLGPP